MANRRIQRAERNKRDKIRSEEFFKANPDSRSSTPCTRYYQREYVRPWAKSRHPDGFRHRPTFTEPSAEKHPFWYQLMKDEAYKTSISKRVTLQLQLFVSDEPEPTGRWMPFKFRPDSRIRRLREVGGSRQRRQGQVHSDVQRSGVGNRPTGGNPRREIDLSARPARRQHLSLLYRGCSGPAVPHQEQRRSGATSTARRSCVRKSARNSAAAPVTCAVDLGIRHLAAATVRRDGKSSGRE